MICFSIFVFFGILSCSIKSVFTKSGLLTIEYLKNNESCKHYKTRVDLNLSFLTNVTILNIYGRYIAMDSTDKYDGVLYETDYLTSKFKIQQLPSETPHAYVCLRHKIEQLNPSFISISEVFYLTEANKSTNDRYEFYLIEQDKIIQQLKVFCNINLQSKLIHLDSRLELEDLDKDLIRARFEYYLQLFFFKNLDEIYDYVLDNLDSLIKSDNIFDDILTYINQDCRTMGPINKMLAICADINNFLNIINVYDSTKDFSWKPLPLDHTIKGVLEIVIKVQFTQKGNPYKNFTPVDHKIIIRNKKGECVDLKLLKCGLKNGIFYIPLDEFERHKIESIDLVKIR